MKSNKYINKLTSDASYWLECKTIALAVAKATQRITMPEDEGQGH